MDQINDLLSSLSPDDIDSLKAMAGSILGGSSDGRHENAEHTHTKHELPPQHNNFFDGIDPSMLAKLGNMMQMFNSKQDNNRTLLLKSLKPMLSQKRRERADEAIRMLRLFEMLPQLGNLNIF
ncbi:MAG: hypothetical protein LBH71_02730 [Oscillospiraceae bacterium]|jgi:hypothetical protein|nr:hypothetical protein [Oscillospiraceae bacterium]